MLIRHTDTDRECSYDRDSHIVRLDMALDDARQRGWTLADRERDWKLIYLFELQRQTGPTPATPS